jgi:hypothetical protein
MAVTTDMFKKEGPAAFYKGITPRVARVAPGQAVVFTVYEKVRARLPVGVGVDERVVRSAPSWSRGARSRRRTRRSTMRRLVGGLARVAIPRASQETAENSPRTVPRTHPPVGDTSSSGPTKVARKMQSSSTTPPPAPRRRGTIDVLPDPGVVVGLFHGCAGLRS